MANIPNSEKKLCISCGKPRTPNSYYKSDSKFHADGRLPICKDCCLEKSLNNDYTDLDMDSFYQVLRLCDKPFVAKIFKSSVAQAEKDSPLKVGKDRVASIIGLYMKNLRLKQYQQMTYEDSVFDYEDDSGTPTENSRRRNDDRVYYLPDDDFVVTADMIRLFGEGCTAQEYKVMLSYYDTLKDEYPNITASQKKLLLRYVRAAAREEIATNNGNTADAEKWGKLSSDALKQLNQSDLQGGINSFSEFFQKVERTQDVVRILPKYRFRPNDALDFVIWCFINYCRRLEGKTECNYEDVYKFYDEKVAEYIQQYGDPYGIFDGDPTVSNREKIKEFIELPPDYNRWDD